MTIDGSEYGDNDLGVSRIVTSLERELQFPHPFYGASYLIKFLTKQWVNPLICICDTMTNMDHESTEYSNNSQLVACILHALRHEWISECKDLCQTLQNPHLRALLYAADCIAGHDYYPTLGPDNDDTITCSSMGKSDIEGHSFKMVQVVKDEEPLGATVRFEDNGAVIVARVIHGGAAYRSGLINVGDEIYEVNGYSVKGKEINEVLSLLECQCQNSIITFKLIPSEDDKNKYTNSLRENRMIVRTHFDYNPQLDEYHPCASVGISFNKGNILDIVSRDDPNWWQAKKVITGLVNKSLVFYSRTGLIPAKQFQERRFAAMRDIKSQYDANRYIEIIPGLGCKSGFLKKKHWITRKVRKIMYDVTDNVAFDKENIVTYTCVSRYFPNKSIYRPIVLIGPDGVGRKELIKRLISQNPSQYKQPVAHTNRTPWDWEFEGFDYYFVDSEFMEREISYGGFVEYGEYKNDLYGIHRSTLHKIINSGYVCLLNPFPQTLKVIYTAEFKPYVIFIKPPYQMHRLLQTRNEAKRGKTLMTESKLRDMIFNAHKINYIYGHYFDTTIVNDDLNETVMSLIKILNSVANDPQWVPANWVHTQYK